MAEWKRILVLGCPGSGKSTFSRRLHDITGIPLTHLDNVWWKPDGTHISREEFDQKLAELMEADKWILDGDYSRTYEARIKACDTAVLLDIGTDECLSGIRARIGKKRPDMPWTETEPDPELTLFGIPMGATRQEIADVYGEPFSKTFDDENHLASKRILLKQAELGQGATDEFLMGLGEFPA